MNERLTASGTLNVRVLLSVVFILGVILTIGPASLVRPVSTTAQEEASFPPEGDWYTYANGDDILVLELEGDILWAGTRAGGLVRWNTTDGTFVQYLKPQDPLAGNTVRDIYIDANGHKWLATDYGLSVLDDKGTPDKTDDDWYAYTRETTNGNLPSDRVTAVAVDDSGFLWIGTSQYWDNEAMLDIGGDEPVLAQAYVGGGLVKVDTKGTLDPTDDEWLQTYTVANTADMSSCSQSELVLGLASDNITDILPVAGDRIWVATQKHFAFSAANANNACAFLLANPNDPGRWVQILGGLSRLDYAGTPETEADTWRTWTCEVGPQRDAGVSCTINHLKLDANGYVWAAMRSKGVIAFPSDGDRGLNYVRFDKFDGLASNDVESLAFGPPDDPQWQNTVWMGTYHATSGYGRGVSVLDHNGTLRNKDDDKWNDRNQNPIPGSPITTENGLPDDRVQAMVAGAGKVWMGTGGMYGMAHGISALNMEQWAFQESLLTASSDPSTGLRTGLPYNYIADLAVGEEGTRWENQVWVATGNKRERKYGLGALLLHTQGTQDPGDDTWTSFTKEETDDDGAKPWTGLASNNITALAIDGDYVWFGTQPVTWEVRWGQWSDGGLSVVYDGEQWTIRTDANTGGDRAGMFDDRISALAIGCTDEVWIALGGLRDNSGLGINVLDTMGDPHNLSNDEWWDPIMYRTIPSNLVTGIAPDCVRSQMWISSAPYFTGPGGTIGGGVARYDYETGTWTSWTTRDGIESFQLDRNTGEIQSISVGPDGTVWAGAWGTLNLSRRKLIDEWPYVPAAINWFRDGIWSNQVFPHDGWVSSIAIDEDGIVWAGTSRGGMDIAHPDGKEDDSLADRAIGGIKLTVDGTAWEAWTPDNSPVVTTDIEVIKVAPDGDVWVGTNGWGIMRFHPKEPATPTPTATQTPTGTLTPPTPTSSPTPSPTLFVTAEAPSPTPTVRVHRAYMSMAAKNWFGRPIWVPTAEPPTATPTPSPTPPATSTPTPTLTPTITSTFTQAPPTATATVTPTPTSTSTPTITLTPSPVPTGTWCASDSTDPACSSANITLFTTKDLYDIAFVDSMHGFIVGEDGFVAHTQDGGDTWTHRTWGIATLRDISMVNDQVTFIAGDNQTILRTTNGGGFFQKMQLPSEMQDRDEDFRAIFALSADDAWALGYNDGCVLHWNGQAWSFGTITRCSSGVQYTGLAMTAPDQGWAISEEGHIYRYSGGWTEFPAARASGPLWTIEMHSPTEGWAAGNGGVTVHYVNGRWAGSVIGGAFAGGGITGLHIRAPDDVWATAAMGTGDRADGAIYRYQGNRWAQVEYRSFKQLNGIWVNDTGTNGWAIGNDGFTMRYVIPSN